MSLERPDKPSFCIIAPTDYMMMYTARSNTHLVLAHLVDIDEKYTQFYKAMSGRGDFLIMDNGAFELGQSYHPEKLIELGTRCGASAIVLPDYPNQDPDRTVLAAIALIPEIKAAGFYTMFVPQSKIGYIEDWLQAYKWAAENDDIDIIGMSILGMPNAMPYIPKCYARVVLTTILLDRGWFNINKYHHYLGLNSAPNLELPSLIQMNVLDSCDSSNPVWAGINGYRYNICQDSFLPVAKKYLREVDFSEKMSTKGCIHEAIRYNLDVTFNIFENPGQYIN